MRTVLYDLGYACRVLRKHVGIAALVILTFAIGIGANTAIFSIFNAMLLQPLPYASSQNLVKIWSVLDGPADEKISISPPELLDLQERRRSFERIGAYVSGNTNLTGAGDPERIRITWATHDLLPMLGVQPSLGRVFTADEDRSGADRVVVLDYGFWKRRFGGDPGVVGTDVVLNGNAYTVVGVMPRGFYFLDEADLWAPLALDPSDYAEDQRGSHFLRVVARLDGGSDLERARADVADFSQALKQAHPDTNANLSYRVGSLQDELTQEVRGSVYVLMGAVGLVLLIVCANIACLLLSLAATRRREVAIRLALGAAPSRVVRQFLTESIAVATGGGLIGLLLAWWAIESFATLAPTAFPRVLAIRIDWVVVSYTLVVSTLTGIIVGLVPALEVVRANQNVSLKDEATTTSASRGRFQRLLVAAEIALAVAVLFGTGLVVKSLIRLTEVDPGFDPSDVLTAQVSLPRTAYGQDSQRLAFFTEALERVETLGTTEAVGLVNALPLSGSGNERSFALEGAAMSSTEAQPNVKDRIVGGDYFGAIGIPVLAGRSFGDADRSGGVPVAIVSQSFAARYWPGQNPVGKRLTFDDVRAQPTWIEVVGVVGDVKDTGLDADAPMTVYRPLAQVPDLSASIVVKSSAPERDVVAGLRSQIGAIDENLPVFNIRPMSDLVDQSLAHRRSITFLLACFGLLALVLTVGGVYAVTAFSVGQRVREIGIRLALGARPGDIVGRFVAQGLLLSLVGSAIGVGVAWASASLVASLLFDVPQTDLATFALTAVVMVVTSLLACYVPARRAGKIDPIIALRRQ